MATKRTPFSNRAVASAAGKKSKRGKAISTVLGKILEARIPGPLKDQFRQYGLKIDDSVYAAIEGALVIKALGGNVDAIREIHNRLEGLPIAKTEVRDLREVSFGWEVLDEKGKKLLEEKASEDRLDIETGET